MSKLKFSELLLVGSIQEKRYFEEYFKKVKILDSNQKVLEEYTKSIFPTIFLDCDSKKRDVFDVCRKIRKKNHSVVIVLLTTKLDRNKLEEALPLHLSGCIFRPFNQVAVERVLSHVKDDLSLLLTSKFSLKDGYSFDVSRQILYNNFHKEVKLTKNELHLLSILIRSKDEFIDGVSIEHEVWEDDSIEVDCSNRLKNLLYTTRKKLPEGAILNNYRLGYKLIN